MRNLAFIGVAILCVSLAVSTAFGAEVAKIGIVDFQRILESSVAGKKAQAEINTEGKKMETELKRRGDEIEESKKRFEREALVMSPEMRGEKERELRININDLKTLQQRYLNEFKMKEARLVKGIENEVFEVAEKIGKNEGFLLIIEKREAGVIYYPNSIEITDKVIKAYDAAKKTEAAQ